MSQTKFVAVVSLLASAVVQANQRSCDGECPSDGEPQNGVSLLQTKLLTNVLEDSAVSSSTEHWSGGEKGWLGRFPELEVAVNGITHAERCAQIWKALGENRWMEFVDGRAHAAGPHVFDQTVSSHSPTPGHGLESGSDFDNQDATYDEFSTEGAWKSPLSIDKLVSLNARHRGADLLCADMVDCIGTSVSLPILAKKTKQELIHILAEYHDAIDAIQVPMSDRGGSTHIEQALPYIAGLYHKLALLHPFSGENSRTRSMVLQTELVRQGGHPVVLWDNYHGVYTSIITDHENNHLLFHDAYGSHSAVAVQLQEFVLDGWCGWEIAYNTKASPFLPVVQTDGASLSTPHAEYDAVTGACKEGPMRSLWKAAFHKNHPDKNGPDSP